MTRYVIVGGGPAGVSAATAIRSKDADGSLVILDRDQDIPYYRTELDTYIAGTTPEAELPLHPEPFYRDQRIDLRLRTVVARLRPAERAVDLDDGSSVEYDALLLAPGSRPLRGPWPGAAVPGVMTVRTWDDAREVIRRLGETSQPVVVVGGGVLGLILAEGIHQRGKRVTLLERERTLWAPLLDDDASGLVRKGLEGAGVEVGLGEEVTEVSVESGRVSGIHTSRGRRLETELVVVAIGVRPDLDVLEGSGIRVDRGILIDHEFRTNVPGIFAAGDAAQAYDPITGLFRVVTNWNNAMEQGRLAGLSMAGSSTPYRGVLVSNSEGFFGIRVSVMGLTQTVAKALTVLTGHHDEKGLYRKLVFREGKLIGALLVGNVSGEGMIKKFILEGRPVTTAEAKSKFLTGMVIEERTPS